MTPTLEPTNLLPWLTVWGAVLSTGLACIKIWETFWKDRIRLAKSYSFAGEGGPASTISIANLTALPVLVSSWELVWEPKVFRWRVKRLDCTPDDISGFTIDRYSVLTLEFDEQRFPWGYRVSRHRTLCLYLKVYGRKRRVRLVIS
ncbi:hypothetical protein ABIA20_005248 [Sinorhizobium fredii]